MRVLAIQSSVVRGHVGNSAAVLPLQVLGVDVDALHTVSVSNHSGYPVIKGTRFPREHFEQVFAAMRENGADEDYDLVLTGYMGLPEGVPAVAEGIRRILERNPRTLYLLDPVLGDNGKLYLPPAMIDMYKQHFLPLAAATTPNQFEAETLSGIAITSVKSAVHAAQALARQSPALALVVVTTLDTHDAVSASSTSNTKCDQLGLLVYSVATGQAHVVTYPRLRAHFTGTGDLFSALLAAHLAECTLDRGTRTLRLPSGAALDAVAAVGRCLWGMQKVLIRTHDMAEQEIADARRRLKEEEVLGRAAELRMRELRLVQSVADLMSVRGVKGEEVERVGVRVREVDSAHDG